MQPTQARDFVGNRRVIGSNQRVRRQAICAWSGSAPSAYSGWLSKVVSGHRPVVFWPGYNDAPLGARLTSITERQIAVRTVVAPSDCAKSYS